MTHGVSKGIFTDNTDELVVERTLLLPPDRLRLVGLKSHAIVIALQERTDRWRVMSYS